MKNLKDTPFSIDRLYVWAVGIALVYSVVVIGIISYQNKDISRPLQSIAMYCLGSATSRTINRNGDKT